MLYLQSSPHSGTGSPVGSDFEQSLSSLTLRRSRSNAPQPPSGRPLRNVGSSPQLLKQIHEEQEITSDDDALSTHSQTSVVRLRHSSLSMASPELARKILVSSYQLVPFYQHAYLCFIPFYPIVASLAVLVDVSLQRNCITFRHWKMLLPA